MWSSLIPAGFVAWWERRRTLREIQAIDDQEKFQLKINDTNPINLAKIALSLNDRAEALRLWREAKDRYPDFAKTHRDSLGILLGLQMFDEAEMLVREGMHRDSTDRFYVGGYAEVAEEQKDYPEALERWKAAQKKFPGWWKGHVHAAICLRRMNEMDQSEAILRQAIITFYDTLYVWLEWGRSADFRGDWEESIRRWEEMSKRFKHAAGDLGVARALQNLGRFDEAVERFMEARLRHPLVAEIYTGMAEIAYRRGDMATATKWWGDARRRFPLMAFGYQGEIRLLRELRQYPEADEVALEAIDRFPAELWPLTEHATLATDRQDWAQAVERWAAVRAAWPDHPEAYLCAADALSSLGREAEASDLRAERAKRLRKGR